MATVDAHTDHHDDHHHHAEFIAHHFDNAEQQFDSGKLGIWLFLVTEILFFSGLFVAYFLYRTNHPEIFEQAHVFLDKYLGGLNTVVLLFSSLTMALAVRAAQLGRNKNCGTYVLITMVCAAIFLGVKAIEYSHKWDMGILVASGFDLTYTHAEPVTEIGKWLHVSDYLVYLSALPALLLVGFLGLGGIGYLTERRNMAKFMVGMAIMVSGYFLGAVGGHVYMEATKDKESDHGSEHALLLDDQQPLQLMAMTQEQEPAAEGAEDHSAGDHSEGEGDHAAAEGEGHADHEHAPMKYDDHHPDPAKLVRDVGIFFSIYYCMTGLHAIHIIAGIIALAWVYWRCILGHWRNDYFGPVDYVGLYWHLVDLIWIYLFPLLYLID